MKKENREYQILYRCSHCKTISSSRHPQRVCPDCGALDAGIETISGYVTKDDNGYSVYHLSPYQIARDNALFEQERIRQSVENFLINRAHTW